MHCLRTFLIASILCIPLVALDVPYAAAAITVDIADSRDPVRENQPFKYIITVTNESDAAQTVTVRQTLPRNVSVEGVSDGGILEDARTPRWDALPIGARGSRTLTVSVRTHRDILEGEALLSRVTANGAVADEITHVGTFHGASVRIEDDIRRLRLKVSVTDSPDTVAPGGGLTYIIRIENDELIRKRFSMQAILDEDTEYLSSSHGGQLWRGNEVDWDNIEVLGDNILTVYLAVRVRPEVRSGKSLRLQVRAGNDKESESTRVRGPVDLRLRTRQTFPYDYRRTASPPPPTLQAPPPPARGGFYSPYFAPPGPQSTGNVSVDKRADRREARPGDDVLYTVTFRNNTNRTITNLDIQDVCGEGDLLVRELSDGGSIDPDGSLRWRINSLRPGETKTLRYRVQVDPNLRNGQRLENVVTVRSGGRNVASDSEVLLVTEQLPQTGISDLFFPLRSSAHLRKIPETRPSTNPPALPPIAWGSIVAVGISVGMLFGKRIA